jgi:chaperonin GroES
MKSPINPLGDRIVAVREEVQTKTASGIYLPDNSQEKPLVAKVVAVGPEATLKIDDKILYKEYATTEVKVDGTDYLIVRQEDVLATVK